jgi:hypothetical protein
MSMMQVLELTDEQSIQILEKAKELLGPEGENWNKGCWFAIETPDSYRDEYGALTDVRSLNAPDHGKATNWCIMGAVEEAAYQLGIIPEPDTSDRLARPISLQNLVESKEKWKKWSVVDVNDNDDTSFADIKGLIDERLAELRG